MLNSTSAPPGRRNLTAAVLAVAALVVQVTVANRLPLPGSVAPDLVLLTVVAIALVHGSLPGLVTGFCAGLATDVVPPADHTIGRYALVYCLIGYFCGLASDEMERSPVLPFLAVAAGALAGSVLYVGVGMLLGDPRSAWPVVKHILPLLVLYDVIASPFVIWLVLRFAHRGEGRRDSRPDRDRARIDALPSVYRAKVR